MKLLVGKSGDRVVLSIRDGDSESKDIRFSSHGVTELIGQLYRTCAGILPRRDDCFTVDVVVTDGEAHVVLIAAYNPAHPHVSLSPGEARCMGEALITAAGQATQKNKDLVARRIEVYTEANRVAAEARRAYLKAQGYPDLQDGPA